VGWELHLGDAVAVLPEIRGCGALITDPPYSSGGFTRGDRAGDPSKKYAQSGSEAAAALPSFTGDNKDQRAYFAWSVLWLGMALDACETGSPCVLFTDWRQFPVTTDAIQGGGWVWRGAVPWIKPGARPQLGRFTAAAEYALWGSHGPMSSDGPPLPGYWLGMAPNAKVREHLTEKPVELMRMLTRIVPVGAKVLDPFAGSGSTGVAALLEGRRFVGVERSERYAEIAARRLDRAAEEFAQAGLVPTE
jgi:site-specific DNA-methyltransferase (adenine-specific)